MANNSDRVPFHRAYVVIALALIAASVLLLTLRGAVYAGLVLAVVGVVLAVVASRNTRSAHVAEDDDLGGKFKKITTDYLDVRIGETSPVMRGVVRKGLFADTRIASLHPAELALVWQDCRADDPRSAALIEAHLDAVSPKWRDDVRRGEAHFSSGPDGRMSVAEAHKILGLSQGANREQIRHAHRDLMLKLHPDRGGSTYLSSKINEAKDILLAHQKD